MIFAYLFKKDCVGLSWARKLNNKMPVIAHTMPDNTSII